MDNFDYMQPTGKNNKIFLASDTPFLNSDLLFVEYFDVLKSPYFVFLAASKDNEVLNQIFDLSEFSDMSTVELYEWYVKRKRFNVFHNLKIREEAYVNMFHSNDKEVMDWIEDLAKTSIDSIPNIVTDYELNFDHTLKHIKRDKKILKRIMIYTPFYSESIYNDIAENYGNGIEYVYGDLDDVLSDEENKITSNSTFVFSDVSKIYALKNNNLLEFSSVIIADKYGFNYNDYNDDKVKYDLIELRKEILFKLDFFDNIFGKELDEL